MSEFFSDQVWIFNEEIQQQWTTKLCLKYKENNHRTVICFKDWTFFESNQNLRAISATNSNQDQLKFCQKKEFNSVNILASLNIWTKRTSVEKNKSEKTSFSFIKIQCEVWTKFREWILCVKITDNACQLNMIH